MDHGLKTRSIKNI